MAKGKDTKTENVEIITEVLKITQGGLDACLLGTSPIILNRLSEKVKHELLMPRGRKTATEKALSLKHDPFAEYRAAPYILADPREATFLAHVAAAFKGAMETAALDLPGAKKAQIGRLVRVEGEHVGLYGVPRLFMRPVRSADMNRTPDIRTRVILPTWAARVHITYPQQLIRPQAVANLLGAAGFTAGVGDWRPEKGGNYGQFRIIEENDPAFKRVVAAGGRAAQEEGMANPVCYDDETTELLTWYQAELIERKQRGVDTHVATTHAAADSRHQGPGKRARTDHAAAHRPNGAGSSESLA